MDGGAGDDFLISSSSSVSTDTFVFGAGGGSDTVMGFDDGTDLIDLTQLSGIGGFEDLTLTVELTGVVIDLTTHGGGTVKLMGVGLDDLDASDFVFADSSTVDTSTDGM